MNDIVASTRALIGRHRALFLVTVLLLAAAGTASDTLTTAGASLNIATTIAAFVASAVVNRSVLQAEGQAASDAGLHLAPLFGLGLLTGIGIGCGLLLLVVPGLYLAARWSITAPLLYAEDMGVTAAMQASAERTRPHVWPIAGLFLLLYLPLIVIGIAAGLAENTLPALPVNIAVNLVMYTTMVAGWFFALALYAALGLRQDRLAEVFA